MSPTGRRRALVAASAAALLGALGCQSTPAEADAGEDAPPAPSEHAAVEATHQPQPQAHRLVDVFPGIRIDTKRQIVEFDARISDLIQEPYQGRSFYLEQFVASAGTKDHEAVVVTDAKPSNIHAALLLINLQPGRPVIWTYPKGKVVAHEPKGPALDVQFVVDGQTIEPRHWAVTKGGTPFPEEKDGGWVFAGSQMAGPDDARFYEADTAGTIVGLASFGTEVVAWHEPVSHEEADDQLQWVAALDVIPPAGTPVVVRLIHRPE